MKSFRLVHTHTHTHTLTHYPVAYYTVFYTFGNRLYRVNKHPTCCQSGCLAGLTIGLTTVLNEQPLFVQPVVKPGLTNPDWQPVVSCIQTFNRLSNRFDNRFDNRLYRVNGAYVTMLWKADQSRVVFYFHTKSAILQLCVYFDLRQSGYVFIVVGLSVFFLFVRTFAQKLPNGFAWNFQGRLAMDRRTID